MTERIKEKVTFPRMKINTVIEKHLKPILLANKGTKWEREFARGIQRDIASITGHHVGFREVTVKALELADYDINFSKTFSFNIVPTKSLIEEYDAASEARRSRFGKLYNPIPLISDESKLKNRFQISIPSIRSPKQYDVQVIISDNGNVWPVAVIGYYGSNMNGWAKRVGLEQTINPHKYPSTHYMDIEAAVSNVVFIPEIANRFL